MKVLCLCTKDFIYLIICYLINLQPSYLQPFWFRSQLRYSVLGMSWLHLTGWELHVLVGERGKSSHTVFPLDQTHAVHTCTPTQAVPYGHAVKETCVKQHGLRDTALSVCEPVCVWRNQQAWWKGQGEKAQWCMARDGDETSREIAEQLREGSAVFTRI